jgi:uncharacterized membrane protein
MSCFYTLLKFWLMNLISSYVHRWDMTNEFYWLKKIIDWKKLNVHLPCLICCCKGWTVHAPIYQNITLLTYCTKLIILHTHLSTYCIKLTTLQVLKLVCTQITSYSIRLSILLVVGPICTPLTSSCMVDVIHSL